MRRHRRDADPGSEGSQKTGPVPEPSPEASDLLARIDACERRALALGWPTPVHRRRELAAYRKLAAELRGRLALGGSGPEGFAAPAPATGDPGSPLRQALHQLESQPPTSSDTPIRASAGESGQS